MTTQVIQSGHFPCYGECFSLLLGPSSRRGNRIAVAYQHQVVAQAEIVGETVDPRYSQVTSLKSPSGFKFFDLKIVLIYEPSSRRPASLPDHMPEVEIFTEPLWVTRNDPLDSWREEL